MGGWPDEIWFSLYRIACLHERMGYSWAAVMEDYLAAFQFDPRRAEPLFRIGLHYQQVGAYQIARLFLARGVSLGRPSSRSLFVEREVYEHRLSLEYAAACSGVGEHAEAIATCNALLCGPPLPMIAADRARAIRKSSVEDRHQPAVPRASPAPVVVCVPFRDPGANFDDCVESLLLQSVSSFDIVFVDDGSREDCRDRLPVAGAGVRLLRHETPIGLDACVTRVISDHCGPDTAVIVLSGDGGIASRRLVEQVSTWFTDGECQLLYGQYRLASGQLGHAAPAASEAEFVSLASLLPGLSPLCFRARLWRVDQTPAAGDPAAGHMLDRCRTDDLLREAGFHGTRFVDAVLLTLADEAPKTLRQHGSVEEPHGPCQSKPLTVSCLMVTRDRVALAKRAIRCFAAQTYPDRELVVVSDGELRARLGLERYAADLGLENVRFVHEERPRLTLGALRNAAVDASAGAVICQWDDDDIYHPDRIRLQLDQMLAEGAQACLLADHLQYLEDENALLWADWASGGPDLRDKVFPGSLMMFKDDRFRYPEVARTQCAGEDSVLLHALCDEVAVCAARNLGYLYLYTHHGRNTFDKAHHYGIAAFGLAVHDLNERRDILRAAMRHYALPKPYMVVGRDGPAFALDD